MKRSAVMSGFPWTTLITATAPVVAALGAGVVTAYVSGAREARNANRAAVAAEKREVRDAYLGVVKGARALAAALRERDFSGQRPASRIAEVERGAFSAAQIVGLTAQLHDAIAVVQIIGSPAARSKVVELLLVTSPHASSGPLNSEAVETALRRFMDAVVSSPKVA